MKSLQALRQNIFDKIKEVEAIKEQKSEIEKGMYDENDCLVSEVLTIYLNKDKELNHARGSVVRMIKNLFNRIYGSWSWLGDESYIEIVSEFKRFCN